MLVRSAQGLYWMSRYLERARRLCRLLQLQTESLVDRPAREIHFGWSRIYASVNRHPPAGRIELLGSDDYTLADSYTLAGDLTFERSNPDSVWSCFDQGRENARQIRQSISTPMWTQLNLAYLRLQELEMPDIWAISPESFYADTVAQIDTFEGVAAATMYRGEGWRFMQLGRFIERAQLLAAVLLAQLTAEQQVEEASDADWTGLLRLCHAVEVYNRRYSVAVQPRQVLDLLVTDPRLPDSLGRSIDRAAEEIDAIGPGPDPDSTGALQRLAGRIGSVIHYQWPDHEDRHALLDQVRAHCYELHDRVEAGYFDYAIEDAPLR